MRLKLKVCILVMAISAICSSHMVSFAQQNNDQQKKTAPAKEGYSKGERLSSDRMSTRRLHPPGEKKKSRKKKTAPTAKQASKPSN